MKETLVTCILLGVAMVVIAILGIINTMSIATLEKKVEEIKKGVKK